MRCVCGTLGLARSCQRQHLFSCCACVCMCVCLLGFLVQQKSSQVHPLFNTWKNAGERLMTAGRVRGLPLPFSLLILLCYTAAAVSTSSRVFVYAPNRSPTHLRYHVIVGVLQQVVNDYRRFTGEAVRLAMTEFVEIAGDRVKTLGFSWQVCLRLDRLERLPGFLAVVSGRMLFQGWRPNYGVTFFQVVSGYTVGGIAYVMHRPVAVSLSKRFSPAMTFCQLCAVRYEKCARLLFAVLAGFCVSISHLIHYLHQ